MEEFMEAITNFDKKFRKQILNKIENKKELNQYELSYLLLFRKTIDNYKRRKN